MIGAHGCQIAYACTGVHGCTNSVDVVVSEPTALSATNLITNSTCANPNSGVIEIFASGGTEPYNVSWTGESSGDPAGDEINVSGGSYNITSLSAGTYTVTVTDANGCTSVQNILFTELDCPIPVVTLPANLPATLDCESADSYATTDLATYTNGETGNCELSGTLSPNDIRDYDVCNFKMDTEEIEKLWPKMGSRSKSGFFVRGY